MTENQSPSILSKGKPHFFQKADWLCCAVTTIILFAVYFISLPPNLALSEDSGIYVTSAMYPGPSIPSGHPIWTIYGWVFIKLIPFSNIAWRISLASSIAASITCGLIALLVSRIGVLVISHSAGFKLLALQEQKISALVCGTVAGLGLGLSTSFWSAAVGTTPNSFSMLLFTVTLSLISRWFFVPSKKLPLLLAAFAGSMTIVENHELIPTLLGLWILIVMVEWNMSRDVLLSTGIFLWWMLWESRGYSIPSISLIVYGYMPLFWIGAVSITFIGGALWWKTRKVFTEWKTLLLAAMFFGGGLGFYFLLPINSMTVPPIDWGHPRTVEGFLHTQYRGMYCGPQVVLDPKELMSRAGTYLIQTENDYGLIYLPMAAIAMLRFWKTTSPARRWQFGLLVAWLFNLFELFSSMTDWILVARSKPLSCCIITYVIPTVFIGLGLMHIVAYCAKPRLDEPAKQIPEKE